MNIQELNDSKFEVKSLLSKYVYYCMHCQRRLVCTVVVNGLNNFQVGFLTIVPTEGTVVDIGSYTICATVEIPVDVGLAITLECPASTEKWQYVIVQSVDTSAEQLCIAEICVYEGGQCVIALVLL